jgi:hypothetical protein
MQRIDRAIETIRDVLAHSEEDRDHPEEDDPADEDAAEAEDEAEDDADDE